MKKIILLYFFMISSPNLFSQNAWVMTSYNYGGEVYDITSDASYVNSKEVMIGTGATYDDSPFFTTYSDVKCDLLYTAGEIYSSGGVPGEIYRLGFNVYSFNSFLMSGFTIKMMGTSLTSLSGLVDGTWTTVYQNNYTVQATGWQYINLQRPFIWNGIDNIVVEICFDNASAFGAGSNTYATQFPNNMMYRRYVNGGSGCSLDMSTGFGFASHYRADISFSIHPIAIKTSPFIDFNNKIFAGSNSGRIYSTTDKGTNWNMNSYNFGSVKCIAIDKVTKIMYAGTWTNGIHKSLDNGSNWSLCGLTGRTVFDLVVNPLNSYVFAAIPNSGSSPTGVYRSTDNGVSWQSSGLPNNYAYCLYLSSDYKIYVGFESGIYSSTDNGVNWNYLNLANQHVYSIVKLNENNVLLAATWNGIYRSTNEGANWQIAQSTSYDVNTLIADRKGIVYAGVSFDGVYRSTNNGVNWSLYNSGLTNTSVFSTCIDSSGYLYAGCNGAVAKSVNPVNPPRMPLLTSPLNNANGLTLTPALVWTEVPSATAYRVQVSTDSTFTTITYDTNNVSNSPLNVPLGKLIINTKYYWRVNATNIAGTGNWAYAWNFRTILSNVNIVEEAIPSKFKLYNIYPNPFNPSGKIKFDIPKMSNVKIMVFDITGKEIAVLVNEILNPGTYETEFNGTNFSSGVYFYRLQTESYNEVKKMILTK